MELKMPQAPVLPPIFIANCVGDTGFVSSEFATDAVNQFIRDAWARLFEGAELVGVRKREDGGDDWYMPVSPIDSTHTQVRLKPLPIRKPGVTRAEIKPWVDTYQNPEAMLSLLRRIMEEGLRDG